MFRLQSLIMFYQYVSEKLEMASQLISFAKCMKLDH